MVIISNWWKLHIKLTCSGHDEIERAGNNVYNVILNVYLLQLCWISYSWSNFQKQPPRGVPRKRCSETMEQIYRRTPMPMLKCDFNKVALYHTSAWVLSCKFAAYFQGGCLVISLWLYCVSSNGGFNSDKQCQTQILNLESFQAHNFQNENVFQKLRSIVIYL